MLETAIIVLGSVFNLWYSWASLQNPGSHGYFRFLAWEAILFLFALNVRGWFAEPLAWHQLISWALLVLSLVSLIWGLGLLRREGKPVGSLEATTQLVSGGIYHAIRHPLYASLLYLAWGIFFKSPSLLDGLVCTVATAFLYATARADENECLVKFGPAYAQYMQATKMFVPRVW